MILEPAVKDWAYMTYMYVFRLDFLDFKISTTTWTQKKNLVCWTHPLSTPPLFGKTLIGYDILEKILTILFPE